MIKELDVVRLKRDLPLYNLPIGSEGTVHQVYEDNPPAYLVEFSTGNDQDLELLTLTDDDLELIWSAPSEPALRSGTVG